MPLTFTSPSIDMITGTVVDIADFCLYYNIQRVSHAPKQNPRYACMHATNFSPSLPLHLLFLQPSSSSSHPSSPTGSLTTDPLHHNPKILTNLQHPPHLLPQLHSLLVNLLSFFHTTVDSTTSSSCHRWPPIIHVNALDRPVQSHRELHTC